MQKLQLALTQSTSHGLPRVVSNKPIYVRIAWLLLFLLMFSLFLKSFFDFVNKLKSQLVTSSIESRSEKFQLPDVYACFENPVSGSYSGNIGGSTARAINDSFNSLDEELRNIKVKHGFTQKQLQALVMQNSFAYVFSLPYKLLFDSLTHRVEQSVISSSVSFISANGELRRAELEANEFNHPQYLRCLQWAINSTWQEKIISDESWAGLTVTLLLDNNSSFVKSGGYPIPLKAFRQDGTGVPVSDWTMSEKGYSEADRVAGLRVFLSPAGEYPSDFVNSFVLSPGKFHLIKIEQIRNVLAENQFDCVKSRHEVQFANPYDLSKYSHSYSYSYCYYYEYHKLFQQFFNLSGEISPLPWPLRSRKYLYNFSSSPNYMDLDPSVLINQATITEKVRQTCLTKQPCSTLDYSTSISGADWPTQSSLASFINSSVRQAWTRANSRNLSVPALDFLMNGKASDVAAYARENLLKVHFKPKSIRSDKITFSIDYGVSNFVSDVGGIMGIYLGMSLLTLCELLELLFDLAAWSYSKSDKVKSASEETDPETAT